MRSITQSPNQSHAVFNVPVAVTVTLTHNCRRRAAPRHHRDWLGFLLKHISNQDLDYANFLAVMRLSPALRIGALIATICLCVQGQNPQTPPAKDAQVEAKGMPPRATPADYQSHTQAGTLTIAAEFAGHSVPSPQGPLSTEDYVSVEIGLFGAPDAKIKISTDDFTLRINGKKAPLSSQPYGMVIGNVKDPEWEPPEKVEAKSKTSLGSGGGGQGEKPEPGALPPVVHIPIEVQRAMALRVRKAALPEGDRALPVAGLVFFQYRGKVQGIHSMDLIYAGPAGKATLALQP
jgi:hypothetical protein